MALAFRLRHTDDAPSGTPDLLVSADGRGGRRPDVIGPVRARQTCLVVVDGPPPAGGLTPSDLIAGASASTWRFHVLVTTPRRLNWPASVAAADPMSGWVLAADIAPIDEAVDDRARAETLERWLSLFNSRGFRASGEVSLSSTRAALEEILDYRSFDRVLIGNGDCVHRSVLRSNADARLARRLRRDYGLDAAATTLAPAR